MPAAPKGKAMFQPPESKLQEEEKVDPSPTIENEALNAKATQKAAETDDVDVTEDDLKEFTEDQKIPYKRFKEINSKYRTLEKQLKTVQAQHQTQLERAIQDAELRAQARVQSQKPSDEINFSLDDEPTYKTSREISDLKAQLNSLQSEYSHQKLKAELKKLKDEFPDADETAVLGWAKVRPDADLRDLMEESHERFRTYFAENFQKLKDRKKAKMKTAVPTRESGFAIKEEDRPKTFKEANKLLRRLFT